MHHYNILNERAIEALVLRSACYLSFQVLAELFSLLRCLEIRIFGFEVIPQSARNVQLNSEVIDGEGLHVPLYVVDLVGNLLIEEHHLEKNADQESCRTID